MGLSEAIPRSSGLNELLRFAAKPKVLPFSASNDNSTGNKENMAQSPIPECSTRVRCVRIQDLTASTVSDGVGNGDNGGNIVADSNIPESWGVGMASNLTRQREIQNSVYPKQEV